MRGENQLPKGKWTPNRDDWRSEIEQQQKDSPAAQRMAEVEVLASKRREILSEEEKARHEGSNPSHGQVDHHQRVWILS